MLDNRQRKSTNEHSEYNPLMMRLCYVLVLTCQILACIKLHLPHIIQKTKRNSIMILPVNNSPAATKIYRTSIRLQQARDLPFAFRAVA